MTAFFPSEDHCQIFVSSFFNVLLHLAPFVKWLKTQTHEVKQTPMNAPSPLVSRLGVKKSCGHGLGTSFLDLWYKHNTPLRISTKEKIRLITVLNRTTTKKKKSQEQGKVTPLEICFSPREFPSAAETPTGSRAPKKKLTLVTYAPVVCMSVKTGFQTLE